MSVFYDPQKRAAKPWVFVLFLLIPVLLITCGILGGKKMADEYKSNNHQEEQTDIFDQN